MTAKNIRLHEEKSDEGGGGRGTMDCPNKKEEIASKGGV